MKGRASFFSSFIAMMIAILFCCTSVTFAQTSAQPATGTIHGQVTDPSAAAVVGASIIVTTPDGTTLAATTNRDGVFELKNLAPGKYTVEVIAKGFALYKNDAVQVAARPDSTAQRRSDDRGGTTASDGDRSARGRGRKPDQ